MDPLLHLTHQSHLPYRLREKRGKGGALIPDEILPPESTALAKTKKAIPLLAAYLLVRFIRPLLPVIRKTIANAWANRKLKKRGFEVGKIVYVQRYRHDTFEIVVSVQEEKRKGFLKFTIRGKQVFIAASHPKILEGIRAKEFLSSGEAKALRREVTQLAKRSKKLPDRFAWGDKKASQRARYEIS